MNYNSLFNLLYSTEISEATKAEIIENKENTRTYVLESWIEPLVETLLRT